MDRHHNVVIFVIFYIANICSGAGKHSHGHSHGNTNTSRSHAPFELNITNCIHVKPEDPELVEKISSLSQEGKKVIFIYIEFTDHPDFVPKDYKGDIYKPTKWIRTYGRHGRSLLFLRPQFEHLSLTTLSFETAHVIIRLIQSPSRCLSNQNMASIQTALRKLLVLDFKISLEEDRPENREKVCNVHIRKEHSYIGFRYTCCWHGHDDSPDSHLQCREVPEDHWIEFVFTCVFIIKILILLFCPLFVPESLYRKKYSENIYEYILQKPVQLTIKKISNSCLGKLKRATDVPVIDLSQLKHLKDTYEWNKVSKMKKFYEAMSLVPLNETIKVTLNKIDIVVRHEKLVPSTFVPVGIFQVFYSLFVKCDIRKTNSFRKCCKSSIFNLGRISKKTLKEKQFTESGEENRDMFEEMQTSIHEHGQQEMVVKYPWHTCLRQTMRLFLLAALSVPWIIRVYFYYAFEEAEALAQKEAAKIHDLMVPTFEWSLAYTLSPIHPVFLLCYSVLFLDIVVFALVDTRTKKKLQSMMRRSLRDMRQVSRMDKLKGSIVLLLIPCEVCGILGFILSPLYLILTVPVILFSLAFYCLPTINLTFRLLSFFVGYLTQWTSRCRREGFLSFKRRCSFIFDLFHLESVDKKAPKEPESLRSHLLQLLVLPISLLTVFALVLLSMETIIFYVEMILYTVIGIIMNSEDMLKYLTTVFMLGVYGHDCFKGITEKYIRFNKTINSLVVDMNRAQVEKVADSSFEEQKNTAFAIKTTEDEENTEIGEVKLVCKDGIPKWSVRRLILFLDRQDQPYLTEKFFFSTCFMDTAGAPGPLIPNILHALWRFLCICAFLLFVVLIVLAFGEEYDISGTNQMLATLAGGLIPFIFTSFVFKEKEPPELDVENLSFKSNFKSKIENYHQAWDIYDIDIGHSLKREYSSKNCVTAKLIDNATNAVMSVIQDGDKGATENGDIECTHSHEFDGEASEVDVLVIEHTNKRSSNVADV